MFQTSILRKYLNLLNDQTTQKAYEKFTEIFLNPEKQENIRHSSESQYQEGFCRDLFCLCLGYTINPEPGYNLKTEQRNQTASSDKYDNRKADAAIILNDKVVAVIELKGCDTIDLGKVENQAFGYRAHNPGCKYVIISNFERLRFYIDDASDYLEFNLFSLSYEEFRKLYLVLALEQIRNDIPTKLKAESLTKEKDITTQFYKDYSGFKRRLFENICRNNIASGACPTGNNLSPDSGACPTGNSDDDKLLLFRKTQKLLDRLLFIFFCEDRGLIPANTIAHIIKGWKQLKSLDAYQPLYNRFKLEFAYINEGHDDPDKSLSVFAYNGGLFKPDEVLDNLIIDDEILLETQKLSDYDFESDVSVDILGHIFEHSLTEIEEIQQQIVAERDGIKLDKKKEKTGKRKKDGVFYTPAYITKYIVENTVGRLCEEKKRELHIDDETFSQRGAVAGRKNSKAYKDEIANRKQLDVVLDQYKDWLLSLKICDPACGSGAFLNAALSFLKSEHHLIDTYRAHIYGHTLMFQYVDDQILENNLYGVDINEESVEIAKLSLWLHTAHPGRKLTSLNNNIKCGNSLIDDPTVAGDKAFCWEKEFPAVFRPKQKKAWHITTATHDSRTSQRMVDYRVRELRDGGTRPLAEPVWLSSEEESIITKEVSRIVNEDKLNVLAYNICGDHMHLILVCEEEEISKIVGKIKAITSRTVNIAMGRTKPNLTVGHAPLSEECERPELTGGHAPLSEEYERPELTGGHAPLSVRGNTQCSLWTRKFGYTELETEDHLYNAIEYVKNNRKKHNLPHLDVEYPKCVSVKEAFRPKFTGGFDVVIGNPPYVSAPAQLLYEDMAKQRQAIVDCSKFKTLYQKWDLYIPFMELGFRHILKQDGYCMMIVPLPLTSQNYAREMRRTLTEDYNLIELVDLNGSKIFESAVVSNCIFLVQNASSKNKTIISHIDDAYGIHHRFTKTSDKLILDSKTYVWNLENGEKNADKHSKMHFLGDYCYISKGMVVNADEKKAKGAFTRDDLVSETQDEIHCRNYIEAKDLARHVVKQIHYLEYNTERVPSLISRPTFPELYTCSKIIMNGFGKIACALDVDLQLLHNHTVYCVIPWEYLNSVNNKSITSSINKYSKMSRPEMEELSQHANLHYFVALLNSRYMNYLLNSIRGDDFHIYPEHIRNLPIPTATPEQQAPLIALADAQLAANEQLQKYTQKFLNRVQSTLGMTKMTEKLSEFYKYDFGVFQAELKKQKIKLSLCDQDEWEEYFNGYRQDCTRLMIEIEENDRQIDRLVYALYGLTEEEIAVVEGKQMKEEIE